MVTGSPPFGLFFSEMLILRAGFLGAHPAVTAALLCALVVLFCGFAYQVGRLVLGPAPKSTPPKSTPGVDFTGNGTQMAVSSRKSTPGVDFPPERIDLSLGTAIVAAVIAVVSAFYLPGPLLALIGAATDVVWGTK
jgi:formate hydrogenlyase subunit 3/multisubunit Na+/H+ antiporter MnhD subunit